MPRKKSAADERRVKLGKGPAEVEARLRLFALKMIEMDNATAAAVAVGYKPTAAHCAGNKMKNDPLVVRLLEEHRALLADRYEVSADNTIKTLAATAFFDPIEFFNKSGSLKNLDDVDEKARMALSGFKVRRLVVEKDEDPAEIVEVKFLDRGAQIERLMRHLGLFGKDNSQRADALSELLAYVASNGSGLAVKE